MSTYEFAKAQEFSAVMDASPEHLKSGDANIYKQIATPLKAGAWRKTGLALVVAAPVVDVPVVARRPPHRAAATTACDPALRCPQHLGAVASGGAHPPPPRRGTPTPGALIEPVGAT